MTTTPQIFLATISGWGCVLSGAFLVQCDGHEIVAEVTSPDNNPTDSASIPSIGDGTTTDETDDSVRDCGEVVAIGRDLFFVDDESDVQELEGVEQVKGSLIIRYLDADRVDLSPLENLRCVEGDLTLYAVENLRNLDVLSNLERVKYDLEIIYNDSLTDVSGLANLQELGGNQLYIYENPDLPNCMAKGIYSAMLDEGWDGRTCITGNAPDACQNITVGCESPNSKFYW